MLHAGHLVVARLRGVPLRLHWTLPVGALAASLFRFAPAVWLGYGVIVAAHVLGHLAAATATRSELLSVDLNAFGGGCRTGTPSEARRRAALVAWAGVIGQLLLLLSVTLLVVVRGRPEGAFAASFTDTLVYANLVLAGLHVLPIPGLDGAVAWRTTFPRRSAIEVSTARRIQPPLALPAFSESEATDVYEAPMPDELKRAVERIFEDSRRRARAEKARARKD